MNLLIKNAKIISNGKKEKDLKDIYIKNGIIDKIEKNIQDDADEFIDASGHFVLPGLIDIGCRMFESGYESKDNIIRLTDIGKKGGFTTITTSSSANPIVDNKTVVEYINSKTKGNRNIINFFPLGNMTKGGEGKEISGIGEMILTGVVGISDGGKAIEDANLLRDIFMYSKMFDVALITSCIETNLSKDGMVNYGYMSSKLGLKGIPREAEEIELSKNIILAKYTGAKVHISNVTTKGAVDLIRKAKDEGVKITCSTASHYFTFTDKEIDNYNTFAKVMPPLREEEDIVSIKQGLKDGTIDAISSGHTPISQDKKQTVFENAEFGISSLDVAFNIVNTKLIKEENFNIEDITILMSKNPANILGLKNKGLIEKGYDADIIIIDTEKQKVINNISPYNGMNVFGQVLTTVVNGNILYNEL